jgi:hypothetical protein
MADQNINYKITVDVESGTASLRDLQGRIVANQVPIQELRKEFGNFVTTVNSADFNKFKQGLDTISKSNINLKTSTGAATSATLELGRAISDAPYGIRGVANNLSQFASQFSFMSNTVDQATGKVVGFSGALKNLGRAIKANAILLVIQTIISAFDYFAGGAKKAEEANNDFLSSISDLVDVQGDLNDKVEEYLVLQKIKQELDSNQIKSNEKLKKIDDELLEVQKEKASANRLLILNQEKYNESIDKTTTRAKGYLNAQILNSNKLEELTKKENELNNERIDITGKYLEQLKDYRNKKNELTKADADSLKGLKEEKSQLEKRREILSKTSEDYKRLTIDIDNLQKKIEEIEGKQEKKSKVKTKPLGFPDLNDLGNYYSEYIKQVRDIAKKTELENAKTEEERIKIQEKYHLQDLKNKYNQNIQEFNQTKTALRAKLELYVQDQVARGLMSEQDSQNTLKNFDVTATANETAITNGYKKLKQVTLSYYADKILQANASEHKVTGIVKNSEQERLMSLSEYIDAYKTLMGGVTEFINGEYERQLTIEQNKTNALNAELNNRLLNENLSKDERARIQNEIAQNDEALRIKQNEIAKKQFNTQKAFNISMAVADSYLAGVKVLADPSFIGRPWARGIAMAATIASGLASVAAIARQKFQPSAANTPVRTSGGGGSGGGMADRSFNFNLVGNNTENQLANAIQGQFNQPLKAYVVSRDMSNQQQLDANIVDSARF